MTEVIRSRIYNSILQRGATTGTARDFGPGLSAVTGPDNNAPGATPGQILVAGIRADLNSLQGVPNPPNSTSSPAPWMGNIVWTGLTPNQFFLSTGNPPWGLSPAYLHLYMPTDDLLYDVSGYKRPVAGAPSNWDKGGYEWR